MPPVFLTPGAATLGIAFETRALCPRSQLRAPPTKKVLLLACSRYGAAGLEKAETYGGGRCHPRSPIEGESKKAVRNTFLIPNNLRQESL